MRKTAGLVPNPTRLHVSPFDYESPGRGFKLGGTLGTDTEAVVTNGRPEAIADAPRNAQL